MSTKSTKKKAKKASKKTRAKTTTIGRQRSLFDPSGQGPEGMEPIVPGKVDPRVKKMQRLFKMRARSKAGFDRQDRLLEQLLTDSQVGDVIQFEEGFGEVVDNFVDPKTGTVKNKQWKSAGFNRLDIAFKAKAKANADVRREGSRTDASKS